MARFIIATLALFFSSLASFAASIEGRVVSIDTTYRQLTLDSGEILSLTESIEITEFESGQIVRADCEDGTVNALSVQVLEPAPPPVMDGQILEE